MGNALGCCRAPRNDPDREAVRPRDLQASGKPGGAGLQAAASATAASSPRTSLDRRSAARTSIGWYSAVDAGEEEGEDEWHDALSDIDSVSLASALEEFEAQVRGRRMGGRRASHAGGACETSDAPDYKLQCCCGMCM